MKAILPTSVPGRRNTELQHSRKAMNVMCNPMKKLLIFSLLTLSLSSCAQDYKEYTFKDIGLQVKIPNGYLVQDAFPIRSFLDSNGNQITYPEMLKDLEADLFTGLLVISSSDHRNTISFNLAPITARTGDFEQYYIFSKNMQELMAKQQMTEYDTISSVVKVDKINIHKYLTYSTNTNQIQYSGIYLAIVKSYYLVIKLDYIDKTFGDIFEKVIIKSKFF